MRAAARGRARVRTVLLEYGGGPAPRLDLLPPPLLELRGNAGWTRLLRKVINRDLETGRVYPRVRLTA